MGISVYLAIYEQIPQNVIRVRVYTQTDTQTHQVITIPLTSPILNASHTQREKRIPIVSHHCHLVHKSSNNGPRTHIPDRCTRASRQMRGCLAAHPHVNITVEFSDTWANFGSAQFRPNGNICIFSDIRANPPKCH